MQGDEKKGLTRSPKPSSGPFVGPPLAQRAQRTRLGNLALHGPRTPGHRGDPNRRTALRHDPDPHRQSARQ